METNQFSQLEKVIRKTMWKTKTPGVAISITKEDKIIYSKGFGARNLEKFQPMTAKTLIGIGSITKSFTAFSILKLEEMGKLSTEDSVSKYLDFNPFKSHPEMKIKHLLSHSTGIPASDAGLFYLFYTLGDYNRIYPSTNREDFIAHIAEPEDFIISKPGEKFYYNNDMYTCLGFIIEQLSGNTFENFVKKEILDPLDMKRAVFSKELFDQDPENDVMTGYLPKKEGEKTIIKSNPVAIGGFVEAAGGLYVSMEEMMNYAQCLLNKGRFDGKHLLIPESVDKLWSAQIPTPYGYGSKAYYCLGWVKDEDYFPYKLMHHGGGMGTSCASFFLIPDLKIGISCAQNSCASSPSIFTRTAIAEILEIDPYNHIYELRLEKIINEISGTYVSSQDMYKMKIFLKNGILMSEVETDDGLLSMPILPKDLDKLTFTICFTLPEIKQSIEFVRNIDSHKVEFAMFDRYLYRKN